MCYHSDEREGIAMMMDEIEKGKEDGNTSNGSDDNSVFSVGNDVSSGNNNVSSKEVGIIEARIREKEVDARIIMDKMKAETDSLGGTWTDEAVIVTIMFPIIATFAYAFKDEGGIGAAWRSMGMAPEWYTNLSVVTVLIALGAKSMLQKILDHYIGSDKKKG